MTRQNAGYKEHEFLSFHWTKSRGRSEWIVITHRRHEKADPSRTTEYDEYTI